MKKKWFTPEQIIGKLREAEVLLSQWNAVGEESLRLGITEQTYYRWRREYGGMRVEQANCLKELEKQDVWLKRLAVCLSGPAIAGKHSELCHLSGVVPIPTAKGYVPEGLIANPANVCG